MARARQIGISLAVAAGILLAEAPSALAADGVGLWGRTDDKVITFSSFAVMGFFVGIVVLFSVIQHRLETRKERARDELERLRRP